jgi:hypothetical protein
MRVCTIPDTPAHTPRHGEPEAPSKRCYGIPRSRRRPGSIPTPQWPTCAPDWSAPNPRKNPRATSPLLLSALKIRHKWVLTPSFRFRGSEVRILPSAPRKSNTYDQFGPQCFSEKASWEASGKPRLSSCCCGSSSRSSFSSFPGSVALARPGGAESSVKSIGREPRHRGEKHQQFGW